MIFELLQKIDVQRRAWPVDVDCIDSSIKSVNQSIQTDDQDSQAIDARTPPRWAVDDSYDLDAFLT